MENREASRVPLANNEKTPKRAEVPSSITRFQPTFIAPRYDIGHVVDTSQITFQAKTNLLSDPNTPIMMAGSRNPDNQINWDDPYFQKLVQFADRCRNNGFNEDETAEMVLDLAKQQKHIELTKGDVSTFLGTDKHDRNAHNRPYDTGYVGVNRKRRELGRRQDREDETTNEPAVKVSRRYAKELKKQGLVEGKDFTVNN